MNIVQNGGYKLILANGRYKSGSDALNAQVDELVRLVKTADPEGLVTGEGAMMKGPRGDRGRGLQKRQHLVHRGGAGHHRAVLPQPVGAGAAGGQH